MSGRFLGTPYVHSPLGEGEGIDPDPTIRFDAVDCLTFVEETLALSLARDPSDVRTLLVALRYADRPAFEDRNHLMEAQWLPNNVRKGFLRDVTRMYGGADTVVTKKVISKAAWQVPSSKALQLPPDRQVVGEFPLELIPLQKVLDHARDIPSGTVLMVAREDRPNKVTRITHLGFVVQKDGRTFLRHAARNIYRRVVDEDLRDFLLRNSKYSKWKVSGVALYEPVDPAR
ncbi:MAG: DUF1460 domain-containing protein [Myxococcaceae bacterium]|nr:DUF1460 domain-containing protein [Myxococcaceae bacterium]